MGIDEMIFYRRFKNEKFSPDDFNDWVNENPMEAYKVCREIADELREENETLEQLER